MKGYLIILENCDDVFWNKRHAICTIHYVMDILNIRKINLKYYPEAIYGKDFAGIYVECTRKNKNIIKNILKNGHVKFKITRFKTGLN